MIRSLRRRHAWLTGSWIVLVPLAFGLALVERSQPAEQDVWPESLDTVGRPTSPAEAELALTQVGERWYIVLGDELEGPDPLLYWSEGEDWVPADGRLIGALNGADARSLAVSTDLAQSPGWWTVVSGATGDVLTRFQAGEEAR